MRLKVAVVALVPLLAACGTGALNHAQAPGVAAEATSPIETRANAVFSTLTGDALQREAARYLQSKQATAIQADAQCRKARYLEGLAMLEPLLLDFEAQHAAELERISRQWIRTVEEARAQGFEL